MTPVQKIGRILDAFVAAGSTFVIVFAAIFVPLLLVDIHDAPHDGQGGIGGFLVGLPVGALSALVVFVWAMRWDPVSRNRKKYWWKQAALSLGAALVFLVIFLRQAMWAAQHLIAAVILTIVVLGVWISFAAFRASPANQDAG